MLNEATSKGDMRPDDGDGRRFGAPIGNNLDSAVLSCEEFDCVVVELSIVEVKLYERPECSSRTEIAL